MRCDPGKFLVFSDIAAMKILPQTSAMGGDMRMDKQSCWEDLGRLHKREEGTKAGSEPDTQLIKPAALEVISRDVLGVLLPQAGLGREQKEPRTA